MSPRKFSGVVLLAGVLLNCGRAQEAEPQPQELINPPNDGQTGLSLTSLGALTQFSGSLIFWGSSVTADQIQEVAEASRDGRRIKSGMLAYEEGEILPAADARRTHQTRLKGIQDDIAAAIAERKSDKDFLREQVKPLADGWFPGRLDELTTEGSISATDRAHAEGMFEAYCDYKLWELALSPIAQMRFKVRPTPLEFCEQIYAGRYFGNEALCGDAREPQGKVYFECLWKEGVLKSRLMSEQLGSLACAGAANPANYSSRRLAIDAWLASGLLETVLADRSVCDDGAQLTCASLMVDAAQKGAGATSLKLRNHPGFEDLKRCPFVFKRTDLVPPVDPQLAWTVGTLTQLKAIGEQADAGAGGSFVLLPGEGDDLIRNWEKLGNHLAKFSERVRDPATGISVSISDSQFNIPEGGSVLTPSPAYVQQVEQEPAFRKLFDLDALLMPKDLAAARDEEEKALQVAQAALLDLVTERELWDQKVSDNRGRGAASVRVEGVTSFFAGLAVQINREGDNLVSTVTIGDGEPLRACVTIWGEACEVGGSLVDGASIATTFDSSGKLSVDVAIQNPKNLGLGPISFDNSPMYFNELGDLAGRHLKLGIYASQVNGNLGFVSGNATIETTAGQTASGSFSADDWNQRLAAIQARIGPLLAE